MTATDELRRMLDERGVEWSGIGDHTMLWCRRDAKYANYDAQASDWGDKLMLSWACTTEQAIEATLGRGTCRIVKTWSDSDYVDGWRYRCSECMCFIPVNERDPETGDVISAANYCPNCGRKVVE